jgi:sensor domain CHASE-containing protein/HPt (histidine-containing phosphotransfer) domain-containing protein/two-component sensor histidine kinase
MLGVPPVKLRGKILVTIAVTLVCLIGLLYVTIRSVLLSGFAKVEEENTVTNVRRMQDAFTETSNNIGLKVTDWAKWDDTYAFIIDKNRGFVESNLQDGSIGDLKLNYMFFIDSNGAIIFCRGYDPQKEEGYDPTPAMRNFIIRDSAISRHVRVTDAATGIIISPEGPLLVASRPIIKSDGTGPVRGSVVFAKILDDSEIARIADLTHLSSTVVPFASAHLPEDMAEIALAINRDHPIAIRPLNRDTIAGYTLMPDINGTPALLARVAIGRAIFKQGQMTMAYLLIAILIAGAVFGALILVLLERLVLSRIAKLSGDVVAIGASGDHAQRVRLSGKDELARLATSMNDMLVALQKSEHVVRDRNEQMRLIMNTVPAGLLSLDEGYDINPDYSQSVEIIFGVHNLAGTSYFDLLGLTNKQDQDRQHLFEFLDALRKELLPEKEMAGLNPFEEFRLRRSNDDTHRWLRLRYYCIRRGATGAKHILVVVEDITEEKALAEKVKSSERENLQLKAIVEDPDLFRDFLNETLTLLRHIEEKVGDIELTKNRTMAINALFRDVHTIKGTALSFQLGAVSEIAGRMEDILSPLRETGVIDEQTIATIKASLALLARSVKDAVENVRKITGDDIGEENDLYLRIALSRLKEVNAAVNEQLNRQVPDKDIASRLQRSVSTQLKGLRYIPARRGLGKALKIVPGLASRLQKILQLKCEGGEVPVDCEIARELNAPLVHLIRNAIDHGIESSPEDRIAAGKPAEGMVALHIENMDTALIVRLSDDGRGIDPDRLRSAAVAKGVLSAAEADRLNRHEIMELIYRPGFTTATTVTEVSGRGVGMDAVQSIIKNRLGGSISLSSEVGKGTTFVMTIPNSPVK